MDSILTSIKKLVGIEEEYEQFDIDLVMYINSAFMELNQINIGPTEGFSIADKSSTWTEFIGGRKDLESVKTFVYLRVRLLFDPPQHSFLVDSMKTQLQELIWRLMVQADPITTAPMPEPIQPWEEGYDE